MLGREPTDVADLTQERGGQFRPDHGPAVTVLKGKPSDAFTKEVDQQLNDSAGLTDTQKVIAQYWEDPPGSETPPGHWNLFAQWVSRRDHHSLDEDAKVLMALNNALLDASITAWDAKRQWNWHRQACGVPALLRQLSPMICGYLRRLRLVMLDRQGPGPTTDGGGVESQLGP